MDLRKKDCPIRNKNRFRITEALDEKPYLDKEGKDEKEY